MINLGIAMGKVCPQTAPIEFGAEPCLFDIVVHYYTSQGIPNPQANLLTRNYFLQWLDTVYEIKDNT